MCKYLDFVTKAETRRLKRRFKALSKQVPDYECAPSRIALSPPRP